MFVKKSPVLLSGSLLLVGVLVGLSGCGRGTAIQPNMRSQPDSVVMAIDAPQPQPKQEQTSVTLTVPALVQQLYATIYALPMLPERSACTNELGPHYTLTFRNGSHTVVTVKAMRDGCRPVSIAGETGDRHATTEFWAELDQAMYQGSPPARPESLAIARMAPTGQPPQTAHITSAETAQRLYDAIIGLPLATHETNCAPARVPTYQLVFQAKQQVIPGDLDSTCKTIALNGAYRVRGGVHTLNDQFNRLFEEIMAGVTFAPAQPDQLTLTVQHLLGTSSQAKVTNAELMQQIYQTIVTLQPKTPQPDCPSGADKVAGKGTWYFLEFFQWDLPILRIEAYEGSCLYIGESSNGQVLQGAQAFWDLVHRAASQR